jgi:hypothetical protein
MIIEIKNYNPNIATKSLVASFDLVIRDWGLLIRECKLFQKESKKWFIMPNKSVKNSDGTWGTPIAYLEFLSKDMHFKFQAFVLEEIEKACCSTPEQPMEYYPNGTRKGGYEGLNNSNAISQPPNYKQEELPF